MNIGEKIKQRRKELGLSAEEIAQKIGVSPATIYRYESGDIKSPRSSVLRPIAKALDMDLYDLVGWDQFILDDFDDKESSNFQLCSKYPDLIPISQLKLRRVPVIGEIAAGVPITANREYDEYIEVPDTADARKYDLSLRVKGDSMKPRYLDGDLVFIRCQPDVRDGQIAAVVVGGEATLKRVYHAPGGVQLISENPEYSPMFYTEDDVNDIHLIGLAVGFMRWETQR